MADGENVYGSLFGDTSEKRDEAIGTIKEVALAKWQEHLGKMDIGNADAVADGIVNSLLSPETWQAIDGTFVTGVSRENRDRLYPLMAYVLCEQPGVMAEVLSAWKMRGGTGNVDSLTYEALGTMLGGIVSALSPQNRDLFDYQITTDGGKQKGRYEKVALLQLVGLVLGKYDDVNYIPGTSPINVRELDYDNGFLNPAKFEAGRVLARRIGIVPADQEGGMTREQSESIIRILGISSLFSREE